MNPAKYTKTDYVKSSPHFFRMIALSAAFLSMLLFCGSILIQSPLLAPADPGNTPNPAKSAWFLLWIQELVSYSTALIYPAIAAGIVFVLLPWLSVFRPAWRASWFPAGQRWVTVFTLAAAVLIIILTLIAAFMRGPQWQFVLPF